VKQVQHKKDAAATGAKNSPISLTSDR